MAKNLATSSSAVPYTIPDKLTNSLVSADTDPIFIFGLPRSGTTLLSYMLAAHSQIKMLDEQDVISHMLAGVLDREFTSLSIEDLIALKRRYFACAAKYIKQINDYYLVDKSPLDLINIPLLLKIFPKV